MELCLLCSNLILEYIFKLNYIQTLLQMIFLITVSVVFLMWEWCWWEWWRKWSGT